MMGIVTSLINGGIQAGEVTHVTLPKKIKPNATPIFMLHGAGATNANFWDVQYAHEAIIQQMAREHCAPVIGGLMGGDTFANDTGMSRIDATFTYLNNLLGKNYTKAHFVGLSMGGAMSLRYASLNPSKVASIVGIIPLTNLIDTYVNDVAGLRASIATAWGVVYPAPLPAGADLRTLAATIATNKIPTMYFSGATDVVCLPADITFMNNITKGTLYSLPGGHNEVTVMDTFNHGKGIARTIIEFQKAAA